tara:strand:- start:2270 stop:2524 length:255 start_codon:yes stop_codon:yes gene_type:complete
MVAAHRAVAIRTSSRESSTAREDEGTRGGWREVVDSSVVGMPTIARYVVVLLPLLEEEVVRDSEIRTTCWQGSSGPPVSTRTKP